MKYLIAAAVALGATGAMAGGDVEKGHKIVAKKCKSCHTIANGDEVILKGGKVGPNLYGVVGRKAGSYEGFKYSKSMKALGEAGVVWDEAHIAEFVKDPKKYLRAQLNDKKAKSKMTFKLKKEADREAVAAYLASLNN